MSTRQDTENPSDLTAYLFFERKKKKEVTCYLRWRLFYFHEKIFMGVIPAIPTVAMETFPKFFGTDAAQATLFSNHRWSKRFLCSVLASIQAELGEGDPTGGGGEDGSKLMKF